jgi:peptidoglycan/LPS O-acetylase OafA/YrhL
MSNEPLNPPTGGFRPDIQGLRALAVLLVVVFHAGLPLSGGFVGVDVFFVISGYVITAMLLREQQQSGRNDLLQFYRRRLFRLLPALALTVSVTLIISGLVLSPYAPQLDSAAVGAAGLVFGANIVLSQLQLDYFSADLTVNPLTHLWSLGVEGQFYLLFPLLLRRSTLRGVTLRLSLLAAVSFAWMLFSNAVELPSALAWLQGYYAAPGRFWQFALGGLAVLLPPLPQRRLSALLGPLGLLLLTISPVVLRERDVPGPLLLLPVAAAVLLLIGLPAAAALNRLFSLPPVVALGDRSYSWYLWHWPLIVFADLLWPTFGAAKLLAGGLALLPAALSFRFVEQPLRRPTAAAAVRRSAALAAAAALSCAVVPLVAVFYWQPRLLPAERIFAAPVVDATAFCRANAADLPFTICLEQTAQRRGQAIYLIGDSQAEMLIDAVSAAAAALDRPLIVFVQRSCQFGDLPSPRPYCTVLRERQLRQLRAAPPATVIVAQINVPTAAAGSRNTDGVAALAAALQQLQDVGHQLLVVERIPHFSGNYRWNPDRCLLTQLLAGSCGPTLPREAADRQPARRLLREAAAAVNAELIDLTPLICPDDQCRPLLNGERRYADGSHLTRAFAATLAPAFVSALQSE